MAPALEFLSLVSYFSGSYLFVSPSPSKKIERVLAMLGFQSEVSVEVSHLLYSLLYGGLWRPRNWSRSRGVGKVRWQDTPDCRIPMTQEANLQTVYWDVFLLDPGLSWGVQSN